MCTTIIPTSAQLTNQTVTEADLANQTEPQLAAIDGDTSNDKGGEKKESESIGPNEEDGVISATFDYDEDNFTGLKSTQGPGMDNIF